MLHMINTNISLADALFGKTKKSVICYLFARPEHSWHLRELARLVKVSPTMLGKEADLLTAAGIIVDERVGNLRLFRANPKCPIFDELRGIARKTSGVADIVKEALAGIAGIKVAFIFGSIARGEERAGSDVDICLIGDASLSEISSALSASETSIGRPVNPMLYSEDEFREKVSSANPFMTKMLNTPRIFLIGDQNELDRSIEQPVIKKRHRSPPRGRQ